MQEGRLEEAGLILTGLGSILANVVKVSGEEIVKFLPDIFDALFFILVKPIESILSDLMIVGNPIVESNFVESKEKCDRQIFECLVSKDLQLLKGLSLIYCFAGWLVVLKLGSS